MAPPVPLENSQAGPQPQADWAGHEYTLEKRLEKNWVSTLYANFVWDYFQGHLNTNLYPSWTCEVACHQLRFCTAKGWKCQIFPKRIQSFIMVKISGNKYNLAVYCMLDQVRVLFDRINMFFGAHRNKFFKKNVTAHFSGPLWRHTTKSSKILT